VGLIKIGESFDRTTATIRLAAGALGQTYKITNRISTLGLRTMDSSVKLAIRSK
jgi:hypothetical protein